MDAHRETADACPCACVHSHRPADGGERAHSSGPTHASAEDAEHDHGHAHDHGHPHDHGDPHDQGHVHDHGQAHDDGHTHSHGATAMHVHRVAPGQHRPRQRAALLLCIVLTTAMMVVEVLGSYWTGSLMLLSDAAHMLSHSLALFVSYFALRLASARMGPRSHFGFYRAEVLGAFVNGIGVLLFTAWIVWEAVERIYAPVEIRGAEMTAIAVLGLLVNLATAWILHRAGTEDLNTRSAFVHMLGDTVSSVAIVAGGGLLWLTGWQPVDVLLSLGVAAVVLLWGVRLLRESAGVLMEMSPPGVDLAELRSAVVDGVPVVQDLHDVHFWEITSGYRCLTAHVVVRETTLQGAAAAREQVSELLRSRYGVRHATLQMEEA